MPELPNNWEKCEAEHNKNYDPYDEVCEECNAPADRCICGEIDDE